MPDSEKVIDALKRCSYDPDPGQPTKEFLSCSDCPYQQGCTHDLMRDALALLKDQEPKMVVQTTSTIRCPGCGKQITNKGAIHKEIKYCWKCGQAVKWDD